MHVAHRSRLLQELSRRQAAAIIPTSPRRIRNHDSEYRFRPDSDFWYLTGFREPESVLVLLPALANDGGRGRSVLFLREKNHSEEAWSGRRLGIEGAPRVLGVDEALPISQFSQRLPELVRGYPRLVFRLGRDDERDRAVLATLQALREKARQGTTGPAELLDPAAILHELRLFKDDGEIAHMRRAAAITAEAHVAAMREARPGMREHEIEALIEFTFRRHGSTGPAYSSIVAGGPNACILHYIENDCELQDGELLLVDAGSEADYYASDVTRTFPINGTFNAEQGALYELVLTAQRAAIECVRPGAPFSSVHETAVRVLSEGLLELGLLRGELADVIATESYKRFYMHRTSHWLGLDVHDCGAYVRGESSRPLEPGMVLTVEPGLYVAPDEASVEKNWRGIGIRIEDDVLVTTEGREVLTSAIPKDMSDVEAACRGR